MGCSSEGADEGGKYFLEGAGVAGEVCDGARVGPSVVFGTGAMVGLSVVTLDVGANVGAGDMVVALPVGASVGATVSFPGTTTVGAGETVVELLSDEGALGAGLGAGLVVAFSCAELRADRRRRRMDAHLQTLFNDDTILAFFM
jgi:hypothetical protein